MFCLSLFDLGEGPSFPSFVGLLTLGPASCSHLPVGWMFRVAAVVAVLCVAGAVAVLCVCVAWDVSGGVWVLVWGLGVLVWV
jgi:hypothetical protein